MREGLTLITAGAPPAGHTAPCTQPRDRVAGLVQAAVAAAEHAARPVGVRFASCRHTAIRTQL